MSTVNKTIRRITVYCGSSPGEQPVFAEQAKELGSLLAAEGITLVYGGARVGIMGVIADSVLDAGGKVTGVLPHFMEKREVGHTGLTKLIMVDTMHERKMKMYELADAFITLPGGFGTMEELFEMLTWGQLGLHHKPIGLLNTDGYYNPLLELTETMTKSGFLKEIFSGMLLHSDDTGELLEKLRNYTPPPVGRVMTKSKV